MTRRVCIGDRSGTFGLFVSRPGYDVLTDDVNDRNKFSFSSTWNDSFGFALAGEVATGTWVSLPAVVSYWPAIYWDIRTATATYKSGEVLNVQKAAASFEISLTPLTLDFQISGGVRQFSFGSVVGARTIRYAVTTFRVA